MAIEGVKFGTSGLRGLVADLEGPVARRYTAAFLHHLSTKGLLGTGGKVFLARDLRASSAAILADCAAAVRAAELEPVDCGALPTPALALHAMALDGPAIMVTGSHIPVDRNGLKFYSPQGEISKDDEAGILAAFDEVGPVDANIGGIGDGFAAAGDRYRRRYMGLLPTGMLHGRRIGVFEHSSVARDILVSLLTRAGADVVRLGRADEFVAVDTEAFGDAVFEAPRRWVREMKLDALVSTDGDGDRPLIVDETGNFLRGDVIGLLTAQFLAADMVVTPVTSNSAIETAGVFAEVVRTRVGSPYVVAELMTVSPTRLAVGFEASGGTLLGSDAVVHGKKLTALPTRDAVLPILSVLGAAAQAGVSLSELVGKLPVRAAASYRLEQVPAQDSTAFLARLAEEAGYAEAYFAEIGIIEQVSRIDGLRFTLAGGDVVHYRASGNAPELRCYSEGLTPERAEHLVAWGLAAAKTAMAETGSP